MVTIRIESPEELVKVVKEVLKLTTKKPTDRAHVLALHGDLGAGKTTFTQKLAAELGVTDSVNSPTFTIMKSYDPAVGQPYELLVHIDAYRIDSLNEMEPLHFNELLAQPKTLICIEWAERINKLLPPDTVHVRFSHIDRSRIITIEHGD